MMMWQKKTKQKAQSIIELSILGAALLGILGLLIRYSTSLSDAQNSQLKAMRQALWLSAHEAESLLPVPSSPPTTKTPNFKTANRKSASVLWIEDQPTVEGGEKYGAASLTPSVSFGSGTMTNLLQYPMRTGDPNSVPVMDIYVNGKHFSFTTLGFGWAGYFALQNGQSPAVVRSTTLPVVWNYDKCNNPNYSAPCLSMVPKPREDTPPWGFNPPVPVVWTKIPRTDKRFCYGPGDPPDHYCTYADPGWAHQDFEERWRLDKINKVSGQFMPPVPVSQRYKMQWQWFPVILNSIGIGFWSPDDSLTMLDVDYDGHEESITQFAQSQSFDCGLPRQYCEISARHFWSDGTQSDDYDYQPNSDCCHNAMGGWEMEFKIWEFFTIDMEEGDINMGYDTIDKLKGKPKPGFVSGKAKIKTYAEGDLDISQAAQGGETTNTSQQTKNTINVIEREIQLSKDTGRFVPGDPKFDNPDVDVACHDSGNNCCETAQNKYKTCFNRSNLILYVRTLTGSKIGHKYQTKSPTISFP